MTATEHQPHWWGNPQDRLPAVTPHGGQTGHPGASRPFAPGGQPVAGQTIGRSTKGASGAPSVLRTIFDLFTWRLAPLGELTSGPPTALTGAVEPETPTTSAPATPGRLQRCCGAHIPEHLEGLPCHRAAEFAARHPHLETSIDRMEHA